VHFFFLDYPLRLSRNVLVDDLIVARKVVDGQGNLSLQSVPTDGETLGEVFMRGNITMSGWELRHTASTCISILARKHSWKVFYFRYLKNEEATKKAFLGGYFHSGDLAVAYPDGRFELKDRSKGTSFS
jgi:fatty-acyl-CoA synthase